MKYEFKVGIDDGLHPIVLLDEVKPLQDRSLELGISLVFGLMLHIKYRGQIAILEFHRLDEMIGLLLRRGVNAVEMVGSTGETIFTGLEEIIAEVLIGLGSTFRSLDHDKADGALVDAAVVLEVIPVNTALMMRDVDTVDFIAFRIVDGTIECSPSEAEGADKEIVEEPNVAQDHRSATNPPAPGRDSLQEANDDVWLTTATRTMVSVTGSDTFPADDSFLGH